MSIRIVFLENGPPIQLLTDGRAKPTLVLNQSEIEYAYLSTQPTFSADTGMYLPPGFGYQCDPDINLWAYTNMGRTTLCLHESKGTIFQIGNRF